MGITKKTIFFWKPGGRLRSLFILPVVVILLFGFGGFAFSADEKENTEAFELEEMTVTATKTGETNLQETPLSITVFSSDFLLNSNTYDLPELAQFVPNAQFSTDGPVMVGFIRGIGTTDTFIGAEQNVGFYLDGVYIEKGFGVMQNFIDVERIEVLRGPQGTLYGRNATSGTVDIIFKQPTDNLTALIGLEVGNYGKIRVDGTISGPLIEDRAKIRLTFSDSNQDGTVKNLGPGADLLDEDYTGARGELQLTPTDILDIRLSADYLDSESHVGSTKMLTSDGLAGTVFAPMFGFTTDQIVIEDFWTTAHSDDNMQWIENRGVTGKVDINLPGDTTLRSITAVRKMDLSWRIDIEGTLLPLLTSNGGVYTDQFSQELQLNGRLDRLTWVAGLFYYKVDNDYPDFHVDNALMPPGPGQAITIDATQKTDAWAAYGNLNYALTDKFSVEAGMRYSKEEKELDFIQSFAIPWGPPDVNAQASDNWDDLSPKFGVQYRASEDALIFASVSKGFKSGGYAPMNPPGSNYILEPEKVWSYEAGVKTDWLNSKLRANLTAFLMDYTNLQTEGQEGPFVLTTNASAAEIKGFELEMTALPANSFMLTGSLSYLDARYTDTLMVENSAGILVDANGNYLPHAPKWKFVFGPQYGFALKDYGIVTLRGDLSWTDDQYFFSHNDQVQKAYTLVNGVVRFETYNGRWSFALYGKNLTDEKYFTQMGPLFGANDVIAQPAAPMTFGLQVTWKYRKD